VSLSSRGEAFRERASVAGVRCLERTAEGRVIERVGRPRVGAGTDLAEVAKGADAVIVALPAFTHERYLRALLPLVSTSAVIVLMPAYGCGDLLVRRLLSERGDSTVSRRVVLMEQLPWVCRVVDFGSCVDLRAHKREVRYLEVRAGADDDAEGPCAREVVDLIASAYRGRLVEMTCGGHRGALALTISNPNAMMHAALLYGHARRGAGSRGAGSSPPSFYHDATDEGLGLLVGLDDEVMALRGTLVTQARELEAPLASIRPFRDWIRDAYRGQIADPSTVATCMRTNAAFAGLLAPAQRGPSDACVIDIDHRYLTEDVVHGLLPLKGVSALVNANTPVLDRLLTWGQELLGARWIHAGRLSPSAHASPYRTPQRFGVGDLRELLALPR